MNQYSNGLLDEKQLIKLDEISFLSWLNQSCENQIAKNMMYSAIETSFGDPNKISMFSLITDCIKKNIFCKNFTQKKKRHFMWRNYAHSGN